MNHILTGAALGSLSPNLGSAFLIGTLAHFILDRIPHLEYDWLPHNLQKSLTNKQKWFSILFGVFLGLLIVGLIMWIKPGNSWPIILAGLLGCIWLDIPAVFLPWFFGEQIKKNIFLKPLIQIHFFFHNDSMINFQTRLFMHLVFIGSAIAILCFT